MRCVLFGYGGHRFGFGRSGTVEIKNMAVREGWQREGLRMCSIERDAFTPATDYPPGLVIDGIGLRDRVWLDYQVGASLGLDG